MSEFESYWMPLLYGLVPNLSKKLSKLPHTHTHTFTYMCEVKKG